MAPVVGAKLISNKVIMKLVNIKMIFIKEGKRQSV